MATPAAAHGKRAANDSFASQPTRKAPRVVEDSNDLDALLEQLGTTVRKIKSIEPSTCTEAQLAAAERANAVLQAWMERVDEQHEAIRNPPPQETPIPFDHLVHALSFLKSHDLASCTAVSRHFQRAVPEAVRTILNVTIAGGCEGTPAHFQLDHGEDYCPKVLARVERSCGCAPRLIKRVGKVKDGPDLDALERELDEVHPEVLYLHNKELWEILAAMPKNGGKKDFQRVLLLKLLDHANIPVDELSRHAQVVVEQLRSDLFCKIHPISLFGRLHESIHIEHVDILIEFMQDTTSYEASQALKIVRKSVPKSILKAHLPTIRAMVEKGDTHDVRQIAREFCREIECTVE